MLKLYVHTIHKAVLLTRSPILGSIYGMATQDASTASKAVEGVKEVDQVHASVRYGGGRLEQELSTYDSITPCTGPLLLLAVQSQQTSICQPRSI